ncbi:MAG: hypothetical protein MI750_09870 [Xanthomonadales bacterium]|jgi:hypothetical protein|nr:hypothetical protein [Xanthomonadales bacterium]
MNKTTAKPVSSAVLTELHGTLDAQQQQEVRDYFAAQSPADLDDVAVEKQWQNVQLQLQQQQQIQPRLKAWATAAVVVLGLSLIIRFGVVPNVDTSELNASKAQDVLLSDHRTSPSPSNTSQATDVAAATAVDGDEGYELAALRGMSSQLEQEWQRIRQRPRAVTGAEVERQLQLTGLIASVDARLTAVPDNPSRQRQLWRQRVVLMNELVAGGVQAEPAVWTL